MGTPVVGLKWWAFTESFNTTGSSTVTASYNNAGRLKTLANGASTETTTYNALGQRIQTSGGVNGTVLDAYDEAGHLLGEYDGTGAPIEETVWLGDIPVATLRPNGATVALYYAHSDQLNTPRQVTRPSDNAAMWTWNSDPFGTDAANPNPAGTGTFAYNLRLPGQIFDGQAGLHQNYFRDFDPAIGRYIQSDPIGLNGGINTYSYGGDSSITFIDPLGLFLWPWEIPVSVTGGSQPQRDAANTAVAKILNTPRGRQLLDQIVVPWYWHGSPKTIHLNCDQKNAGELGGSNIWIDPTYHPLLEMSNGRKPPSLLRAIAHELGHTLGTDDDGLFQMNNVDLNENPISTQAGERFERIAY